MSNPHEDSALSQLAAAQAARQELNDLRAGAETYSAATADRLTNTIRDAHQAAKVYAQLAVALEVRHRIQPPPLAVELGPPEVSRAERIIQDRMAGGLTGPRPPKRERPSTLHEADSRE